MEINTLKKKDNTCYRTFCHVCLSRDRRLFSTEKYANIFLNICEGKFTAHTLLCWECTAVLRRIKLFKERVELSTKILNKCVNGPVYNFNSLSSLKITEIETIVQYEECEKVNNITEEEIVVNSSNNDNNPIINYSLEENEELIDVKEEFSDSDNDIVFDDIDTFENNGPYLEVNEITPTTGKEGGVKSKETLVTSKNGEVNNEETPTTSEKGEVKSEETPATSEKDEVNSEETPVTSKNGEVNSEETPATSKNGEVNSEETPTTGKKVIRKKKQYISIPNDVKDVNSLVRKVLLTSKEVKFYMDEQRSSVLYKNSAYRCEQCACSWNSQNRFFQHNKKYHTKSAGKLQCDICLSRFKTKKDLTLHMQQHFMILECSTCAYRSYKGMKGHVKSHREIFECIKCNARFSKLCLFRQHHKELHHRFICDICGRKAKSKKSIENHIGRHFEKNECKLCNLKYKTRNSFLYHKALKHSPKKTADAYCVQCDKKFSNIWAYKNHVARSTAHAAERNGAAKKVPCPDCGRQYHRKCYMQKHYMQVHMNQFEYYCEQCNKHFSSRTRYSEHMKYTHEGLKRKKNKLCNICGRGFSTTRILNYHVRTHTGERPHECSYCGAKFIQPYAMRVHVNNVHLKNKRPNLK